jgi:hypothetical protein
LLDGLIQRHTKSGHGISYRRLLIFKKR